MPKDKVVKAAPVDLRVSADDQDGVDGRLLRGERSRQQIVDALFKLIRGGEMNPGAAQVAEAAKVSLRTVFRHFEEMDSLRMEMTAQMEAEIRPILQEPFEANDWRGRVRFRPRSGWSIQQFGCRLCDQGIEIATGQTHSLGCRRASS
jgi:hypothetical protein